MSQTTYRSVHVSSVTLKEWEEPAEQTRWVRVSYISIVSGFPPFISPNNRAKKREKIPTQACKRTTQTHDPLPSPQAVVLPPSVPSHHIDSPDPHDPT